MNMAAFAVIVARERETDLRRLDRRGRRARPRAAVAGVADDDLDARPRRDPRDGGLHRQVLPDRRGRLRRLHVARRGDRDRLDDLARLLPAGDRGDVDARGARGRRRATARPSPPAQRPARSGRLPALAGGSPELDAEAAPDAGSQPTPCACQPARSPRSCSSRCSPARRRSSSASSRSRCSTSCTTPAARSAGCSEP